LLNRSSGRSPAPGFADLSVEIVQKATTSSSAREVAMGLIEGDPPEELT
jgi:hypothetical protein